MKKQLLIAGLSFCLSMPVIAGEYEYCKYKFVVTNSSQATIRVSEGWLWPFTSKDEINPYGSKSKCMIFNQVTSVKFEYYDADSSSYQLIPGCPKDFFALHSIKVTVKSRRSGVVPYCKYTG